MEIIHIIYQQVEIKIRKCGNPFLIWLTVVQTLGVPWWFLIYEYNIYNATISILSALVFFIGHTNRIILRWFLNVWPSLFGTSTLTHKCIHNTLIIIVYIDTYKYYILCNAHAFIHCISDIVYIYYVNYKFEYV